MTGAQRPSSGRQQVAYVLGLFETGLMTVQSLGRAGIRVVGMDCDPHMPGFKSRYCSAKLCPDPVTRPEELASALCVEGKTLERRGILYPASDAYVLFLSRHRKELGTYFDFALPPEGVMEAILNKRTQHELAERAGIPLPVALFPCSSGDLASQAKTMCYPAVIKPCYAHLWRQHFDNKGFRVDSPEELLGKLKLIGPTGIEVMVQSVIPGPCTNNYEISFYIGTSGKLLASIAVRKLRQYPVEFGVGTFVESVHYPELKTLALQLLHGLEFRGFGNLEFKIDPRDGHLKMIELNARVWQQIDQTTAGGVNFPLIQYMDLTGETVPSQPEFPEGIKWMDPLADFQSFWYYFRRHELSWWGWVQSLKGTRAFAAFAGDDWHPALVSLGYGMKVLRLPLYMLRNSLGKKGDHG